MGVINYLMTHDWAMIAFLVGTYLLILLMILPVAYVPERQKGKKVVFELHSGQTAVIDVGANTTSELSVSSEDEFVVNVPGVKVHSQAFNSVSHNARAFVHSSGEIVIEQGESVWVEITAKDDLQLAKHTSLFQKYSAIVASLMLLTIWGLLGWIMLTIGN